MEDRMTSTDTMTRLPVGTWTLDPVHSTIGFEVEYLVGTFRGQFRDVDGRLAVGDDGSATLEGSARVASVDVKDEQLAAHLQTPDFFDAERFPELRFLAEGFDVSGGEVRAEGELTIKGVTKPVAFVGTVTPPSEDPFGRTRTGAVLTAKVDRHDFGVSWNTPLPGGDKALADEVAINAELFFTAQD
jgi:polyisoprenoid-binding protein YceI